MASWAQQQQQHPRDNAHTLDMHSIKRAAHRSAWRNDDGDESSQSWIPNPFARSLRQRKRTDEEGGPLQRTQTENDVESPVEQARRVSNAQAYDNYDRGRPKHAATDTAPPPRASLVQSEKGGDEITSHTSKGSTENKSAAPVESDNTPIIAPTARRSTNVEGLKKRRRRKFLPFGGKKEEEEEEEEEAENGAYIQRANSSESKAKPFRGTKIPVFSQVRVVFLSWVNILLVAAPVGIALNYALGADRTSRIVVFVVNFIAIIPLAGMLSFATEELAMYVGETLGGLLNASFGNAVELIVGILALIDQQIVIVQTSLIGSMLSNLLLVLGMCFFFGGLKRTEQFFNITVAQTAASLLALAVGSLIIPTAFAIFANNPPTVAPISRGTAVMLLFVYACYLLFQLKTHVDMYNEPSKKVPKRSSGKKDAGETIKGLAVIGAGTGAAAAGGRINQDNLVHEEEEEPEMPQLTITGAVVTLIFSTVLVAICAEYMVNSIDAVTDGGAVSKEFVGLILLPIVGNAAEHATAVTVAIKDKMDLSIGVAVGSSLQIALLVLPLMILLNWWGVGQPADLTLDFNGFQVSVLFIAIVLVNYLIQDGKSHWLEGVMLQVTYLIIALTAWFYPASADT